MANKNKQEVVLPKMISSAEMVRLKEEQEGKKKKKK